MRTNSTTNIVSGIHVLLAALISAHGLPAQSVTPGAKAPTVPFASRLASCNALIEASRFGEAEACGRRLRSIYPNRWEVYKLLGQAEIGKGDGKEADTYLRLALIKAPASQADSIAALLKQTEGPSIQVSTTPVVSDGPTIEETAEFLRGAIDGYTERRSNTECTGTTFFNYYSFKYRSLRQPSLEFTEDSREVMQTTNGTGLHHDQSARSTYKVDLSQIDPDHVSVTKNNSDRVDGQCSFHFGQNWAVSMKCTNGKNCVESGLTTFNNETNQTVTNNEGKSFRALDITFTSEHCQSSC